MLFPRKEEVLEIHAKLLEQFGGLPGIRDEGLLDSALPPRWVRELGLVGMVVRRDGSVSRSRGGRLVRGVACQLLRAGVRSGGLHPVRGSGQTRCFSRPPTRMTVSRASAPLTV
jgi:hypothetical protein